MKSFRPINCIAGYSGIICIFSGNLLVSVVGIALIIGCYIWYGHIN